MIALEETPKILHRDHENARFLAGGLAKIKGVAIDQHFLGTFASALFDLVHHRCHLAGVRALIDDIHADDDLREVVVVVRVDGAAGARLPAAVRAGGEADALRAPVLTCILGGTAPMAVMATSPVASCEPLTRRTCESSCARGTLRISSGNATLRSTFRCGNSA